MAHLDLDITDGVATLTMNRPEARNALSMEMRAQLIDVLHDIEHDDTVRCVVLKGAGDHFMAGGDVKGMSESIKKDPSDVRKEFLLRIHDLHPIMFAMRRMPKPIIASCRGAAAGAGVSMALACDLVIAADDAFFTLAYCKIGTSPDGSSSFHLPRAVGIKKAMEIALLGDRFGAQEAKDIGMINFVVPNAELDAETAALAQRLAAGPTHVYGNTKALFYRSLESEFESQLQAEAEYFADCASRADFREGVSAFVEKRSPNFTGN
ncbi:enoyl-CoA hydratase [Gammaproteobacteria bacterium]|jgi:2-(1,2-epoxy-1,2-dihydrophenyl)acetyl-CoA isomerase|nr:enoyl-CoA hydratase [Gammaproteobacteria bacterium]MCH9855510.1 enoyl-CoA hydratase [Gammaproteobacteria bacterium]MDA7691959.1 enoyl-CoA hydratase [Gammaproteobacteria bacterium]MDA9184758.1 enoyl-CoA hydratase [Gammaproteobacteria bacterium]MDA9351005.1 enoyl-CoA hydratase [Gammaproteobacteria bacterium]